MTIDQGTISTPDSTAALSDPFRRRAPYRRRVTVVPGGPLLIEGPVDLVTEDGSIVSSDRFVVAVCACRRSKSFPFCDTSHRRRVRHRTEAGEQGHVD